MGVSFSIAASRRRFNNRERRHNMEQRVSLITLGVADLQRSWDLYERLGWKRVNAKADDIVFFQARGMGLALYSRIALAKDANVSPEGHGFSGITLAYNARTRAEVDAVLAQAEAAGAKLLKPAQETLWGGYAGYFADADGFLWEVAWNPFFPIAEDGGIRIPADA
jgi:predicted lactoylglutathione lyase